MSTFSNLMHGAFFQSIFTNCDNYVSSTSVTSIHLDVITGTVAVLYNNDLMYRYTNVSRRAILKFILDDARSLVGLLTLTARQILLSVLSLLT